MLIRVSTPSLISFAGSISQRRIRLYPSERLMWLKMIDHDCNLPDPDQGRPGSLWQCDECQNVWKRCEDGSMKPLPSLHAWIARHQYGKTVV